MSAQQVLERVRDILAEVFDLSIDQITPGSSPDVIENWDSIGHLNLILALEQDFGVRFSPEQIEQMVNVETIVKMLQLQNSVNNHSNGSGLGSL